jgi:uncharacterized repeat protein (TIGR01451 family)
MFRHSSRWPAIVLVAGLIFALTMAWSGSAPTANTTPARETDGPSVITDAQGRFRFDELHSSSHILRLDPQSLPGFNLSADRSTLTLSPGATRSLAVAPGLALRATYHDGGSLLDGVLFRDHDGDGLQSASEPGLAGARVIDPDIYQYFVPFDDFATATRPADLYQSFRDVLGPGCLNDPSTSTTIVSTISLTASSNGTTVFYDHWEDGYDADPIAPAAGSSTQRTLNVPAGQGPLWQNNIPVPRAAGSLLRDGRDRITIIGQPVSMMRASWLDNPGTRLAGAWEMQRVSEWGRDYVIPVGEDLGQRNPNPALRTGDHDYVSVSVMAAYDNTAVTIVTDPTTPATSTRTYTLNAGQTAYVRGSPTLQVGSGQYAIHSGATVDSSLPVQVQVRSGNCRAPYSGRSYSLVPVERWANDYWSPVSGFAQGVNGCIVDYLPPQNGQNRSADADIYITNPNATPLTVSYEGPGAPGSIVVPPNSTVSYLRSRFPAGTPFPGSIPRSNTQGVHLSASGKFWAVTTVDSTSLGNNGADFDWSYALIPARELSARVVLGWAPGTAPPPPAPLAGRVNGSTVYVQAIADGTVVKADLNPTTPGNEQFDTDGDGVVEALSAYGYNEQTSNTAGITLNRGQMVRVSDPVDHDMTGAVITSQDNAHALAVVYGEDACIAGPRDPYLDLGYTVLPLPIPELNKTSRLLIDADRSGDISPGDTLEYKIQVFNNGFGAIQAPVLLDTLPYTYTDFLVASISSVPPPLAGFTYDNGAGTFTYVPTGPPNTPDPQVHQIRAAFPDIAPSTGVVVTMRIILDRQIPRGVVAIVNKAQLTSSNTPPVSTTVTSPINQVDLLIHKTDGRTIVEGGDTLTYTLTYTNAGPGIAYNTIMTDTLPPTALNVSTPTVPGVITPTIDLPNKKIYFQLGTLRPLQVGQTTVTLTLAPNTPAGDVVNSVEISTRSSETNKANNTSRDVDQILPADLLVNKTDGRTGVAKGETLTYTLTYTNAGPGIARNAIMTDTLPTEALTVSTPTVPGVITPTLDLPNKRIIFQLGMLKPGQSGKTTLRLTVGPNTPQAVDYVNTVDIDSRTPDPDPGNNHSQDRDRVVNTTAVVLAEFSAARLPSGVLVRWRTVAELDNYGFRVYRSRTPNRAGAVLITPQIIPGQGRGRVGGATYSFFDTAAPDGPLYYWLEDIDLNGLSEFHGPAWPMNQAVGTTIFLPVVATGR